MAVAGSKGDREREVDKYKYLFKHLLVPSLLFSHWWKQVTLLSSGSKWEQTAKAGLREAITWGHECNRSVTFGSLN